MTTYNATLNLTGNTNEVPDYESDGWDTPGSAVAQVMDHVRHNFPEAVFIWDDEDGVHYVYDTPGHHNNNDAAAYIDVDTYD